MILKFIKMSIFANKKTLKSTKLRLTKSQVENIFDEFVKKRFSRTDGEKTKKREKSTRAARVDYTEPRP